MARLGAPVDGDPFADQPAAPAAKSDNIPTIEVHARRLDRDTMVKKWMDRGYPKAAAEGIADNMVRESGGSTDVIGDGGTSGGLFQHHLTRLDELKDYAAKQKKPWTDPDIQIAFADQEIQTKFPKLRDQLMAATDRNAAEDQFKRIFERPASVMWANRPDGGPRLSADKYQFSDYALEQPTRRRNTDLVMMDPQDYLDLSPPLAGDPRASRSGRSLRASMDRGDKIEEVPSLAIKVGKDGSADVTAQDGRNRALLAQESGLDAIPVAISRQGKGTPTEIAGMSGTILPYDFQPHPAAAKAPERRGVMDWLIPSAAAAELAPGGEKTDPFAGAKLGPAATVDPFASDKPAGGGDQRGMLERIGTGMLDPIVGAGQLIANIPDPLGFIPGPQHRIADAGAGKVNQMVAMRERGIQAERGGEEGIDWGRLAGNVASPVNLAPMGLLGRGASLVGTAGRAAIAGGVAGATQPVTDEGNYGREKAIQIGTSAAVGAAVGAAADLVGRAVGRIADPLLNYVRGIGGKNSTQNAAVREVVRRISQDVDAGGVTTQDMLDLANAVPHKPLTLADVGGQNTLNLAGRIARSPGQAGQIMAREMNERDLGAGARLVADVDSGIAGGSAYDAATALNQARAASAAPLYTEAFAQPVTIAQVRPIQRFVQDPIGQEALQKGMRVMEIESLGVGSGKHFDPEKFGVVRGKSGDWIIDPDVLTGKKAPSMRFLDAVKRGYDEIVEGFRDPTSGRLNLNQYGRAVNQARADYTGYLRTTFPKYNDALDAWASQSQSLDALRAGQDFLKARPEEIQRRLGSLTPNDREFYKMGAADTLRGNLAKKGPEADEAKALLRSDFMRQQLRPLFDSDASFDKFVKSVEAEQRMFGTRFNVLRGSQTAARTAEDTGPASEAFGHAAHGVANMAHHNYLGIIANSLKAITAMARAPDPEHAAAVAKLLTQPLGNGGAAREVLERYSALLPKTRNMILQGTRGAAPAIAPGASLLQLGGP